MHTAASSVHDHSDTAGGSARDKHGTHAMDDDDSKTDLAVQRPVVAGIQIENIPVSTGLWALLVCLLLGAAGGYLVRNGIRL
jgi:hypothetical protein